MEKLLAYLNAMPKDQREPWCKRCNTTEGYIRKAVSTSAKLGAELCIAFERESERAILCEDLRPDVDWAYLRSAPAIEQAPA
jgi:DNA-binding transcriptional regulator YdaS (Cro superfamily)